ncbi:YchJ family metal-binding protein [Microbulbifer sp. ANSA001]|uniref:YchJ family metal-binding protein n=1 Tax=Microbulbifer sp. ANSA001 TaxID=3243358 RepID=UPI0040418C4A
MEEKTCPCCSGKLFKSCCKIYVTGMAYPLDPGSLTRSRHVAELLGCKEYIKNTWHPETFPGVDKININNVQWLDLKIINIFGGENEAVVYVKKTYLENNCEHYVDNNLLFIKLDGRLVFYYSLE